MPWRFQRRITIFPGVRINIGKGGISTSVGPKGADVNIGKHGVTTNAGIPGTGLSYRQRMGSPGTWIGIVTVVAGLGLFAFKNIDKIERWFGASTPAVTRSTADGPTPAPATHSGATTADAVIASAVPASGMRYVRRANSVLRAKPSASSPAIAHELKGAKVTLLAVAGVWSKVNDGTQEGWMRTSVLGETPPKTD